MAAQMVTDPSELDDWLAAHPSWALGRTGDRIERTFRFPTFPDAMAFMAAVAPTAEELDHHPEWRNVYSTVWVELTTHDAGGVTALDLRLAEAMDRVASG